MTTPTAVLFNYPIANPLSPGSTPAVGTILSGCSLVFYETGTTTAESVYADGYMTTSLGNIVNANASGQFVPLYLNPAIIYRVQLWSGNNGTGTKLQDIDPYVPPIGATFYNQTAAETAAGVSPFNLLYPPGAIERYYSGSGDASTAVQSAVNSNARVFSFYGLQTPFPMANYVLIPADTTLENAAFVATGAIPFYSGWSGDHQGQVFLLNGNSAKARFLEINCGNFAAGGIALRNFTNNDASNNEIYNGQCQGILALCNAGTGAAGCVNFTINGNRIYHMAGSTNAQGIQLWRQQSGVVTGNTVRVIDGGGIWSTGCANLTVTGNHIENCGDVGLDCEGGQNICYSGNSVQSCKNSELSWFFDGSGSGLTPWNVRVSGNTAWHTGQYLAWNGSAEVLETVTGTTACLYLTSATSGQRGIVFANNICRADAGTVFLVSDLYGGTPPTYSGGVTPYDCGFVIEGNEFYSYSNGVPLHNVNRAWNIVVRDNLFHHMAAAPSAANYFKNCSGGIWDGNQYVYEASPGAGAYALLYYTDANAAGMPVNPIISNNKFNYAVGDLAFKHQPYTSGVGAILFDNLFTTGYTANGGAISTTDGYPILRGQKLYVTFSGTTTASLNLQTLLPFTNGYVNGKLAVIGNGSLGANYSFSFSWYGSVTSRDGSGSGSGNPTSTTTYASFSGTTITATGPSGHTTTANIELDGTYYQ